MGRGSSLPDWQVGVAALLLEAKANPSGPRRPHPPTRLLRSRDGFTFVHACCRPQLAHIERHGHSFATPLHLALLGGDGERESWGEEGRGGVACFTGMGSPLVEAKGDCAFNERAKMAERAGSAEGGKRGETGERGEAWERGARGARGEGWVRGGIGEDWVRGGGEKEQREESGERRDMAGEGGAGGGAWGLGEGGGIGGVGDGSGAGDGGDRDGGGEGDGGSGGGGRSGGARGVGGGARGEGEKSRSIELVRLLLSAGAEANRLDQQVQHR